MTVGVYSDEYIRDILTKTVSIAVVGLSNNENRPSFFAANYLKSKGYKIIPINPKLKGKKILNEKVYASLEELEIKPDMVDIFLKSDKVLPVVKQAIKLATNTIWLQLGVVNEEAYKLVKETRINFIMNRCPKIEFARLSGELGWAGVNSKLISNQKLIIKK